MAKKLDMKKLEGHRILLKEKNKKSLYEMVLWEVSPSGKHVKLKKLFDFSIVKWMEAGEFRTAFIEDLGTIEQMFKKFSNKKHFIEVIHRHTHAKHAHAVHDHHKIIKYKMEKDKK